MIKKIGIFASRVLMAAMARPLRNSLEYPSHAQRKEIGRPMNDEEKYLFDLRGYIVVKNALSAEQVEDLSSRLETRRGMKDRRHFGSDRTGFGADGAPAWSAPSLLEWGGTYIDLIDLPIIAPYLETLLGAGYRLDHDYINVVNAEHPSRLYLHGGGHQGAGGPGDLVGPSDGGQCYYHYNNGRFFNGLLTVAFELDSVSPSTGGFACVAGSHKVNFPLPREWRMSKKQADIPQCVDRSTRKRVTPSSSQRPARTARYRGREVENGEPFSTSTAPMRWHGARATTTPITTAT